jgi:hypothetical protein
VEQACSGHGLAFEPIAHRFVRSQVPSEEFDRDVPAKALVVCAVHHAHCAAADDRAQPVAPCNERRRSLRAHPAPVQQQMVIHLLLTRY